MFNLQSSTKENYASIRFDTIHNCVHDVFELVKNKFDLKYYNTIGYKIACFINQSLEHRYFIDLNGYEKKAKYYLDILKIYTRENLM